MSSAACQNHPRRDAVGICIVCRAQICSECVTKVDGVNHCVACYAQRAARTAKPRSSGSSSTVTSWFAGLGLLGLAVVLTWAMLEIALPGGG